MKTFLAGLALAGILMLLFILASNKHIILHHSFCISRNTNTFILLKIDTFSLLSGIAIESLYYIASGRKSNHCDINQDVTCSAGIEKGMKVACPWAQ